MENVLYELLQEGQTEAIQELAKDPARTILLLQNWDAVRKCAKLFMSTHNVADHQGKNGLLK